MKQGIPPAVAIVVILIVVIIVAAVGYFVFMKPKSGAGKAQSPDEMKEMQQKMQGVMQEGKSGMGAPSGAVPPGGGK